MYYHYFFQIELFVSSDLTVIQPTLQVMPDDNSELVPPLPIPNRTVKRLSADDSAATSVKVGHRQAIILKSLHPFGWRLFSLYKKYFNQDLRSGALLKTVQPI